MKTALQLYTIRDCIKDKDSLFSALEKVKEIGFDGVEFAGFYDATAAEIKQKLESLSLTVVCCHVSVEALSEKLTETLEFISQIGCNCVALAYSITDTAEKVQNTCAVLKNANEKAAEYGIKVYYHNHDHEFIKNGDILPINEIKNVCNLEVDTFWTFVAGETSAKYLEENKDKIGLVHIKDGTKATKTPCALGEGENDIKSIVQTAKNLGYQWIIVENDLPTPTGLEDVTRSIAYLKSL